MCFCGTSRACPEFSFTEEDIKKFVAGVKGLAKRLFMLMSHDHKRIQESLSISNSVH